MSKPSNVEALDPLAEFLDDADELMAQHIARHHGGRAVDHVDVGSAYRRHRHLDDRVAGVLEHGFVDVGEFYFAKLFEYNCFHRILSARVSIVMAFQGQPSIRAPL